MIMGSGSRFTMVPWHATKESRHEMKVLKVISCKYVGAKSPALRQTPTVRRQCDPVSPETRDGGHQGEVAKHYAARNKSL